MKINKLIKYILLFIIVLGISGCSSKEYMDVKWTLYKKRLDLLNFRKSIKPHYGVDFEEYKQKTINITRDGYIVSFKSVTPYYESGNSDSYGVGMTNSHWMDGWNPVYQPRKYIFEMYTINKEGFGKEASKYFLDVYNVYKEKSKLKNINGFINFRCYNQDKDYIKRKKLVQNCFVKIIDKDVLLFTTFMYKNTKEDKELFSNEIIPTMLKSIKIEPTKIYPWKFNV